MKKRRTILVATCLFVVVISIGWRLFFDYSRVIEINWGITLPWKARLTEIYEKDSGPSFHGDGVRYHVYSYKYEDYIDLMFAWSGNLENRTLFYQSYFDAADIWLSELGISQEQYPDYDACLCWYKNAHDNSEIIIFWNPEINRLYIVENII